MAFSGLEGRVAVVTAGASGIGRAVAGAFAEHGARVYIWDVDEAALARTAGDLPLAGALHADVADEAAVDRAMDAVLDASGRIDILVNGAGTAGPTGPLEDTDPGEWRRCVDVNLVGAYLCMRRALPGMKRQRGGSIVNLSSTAGLFGYPLRSPYCAAKWAIIGLTKTVASEAGPHGVRVNAICPGPVEGARMDRVIAAEAAARGVGVDEVRDAYVAGTSLRTMIAPEDIARTILFLCSDAGARISGQAIAVDGHTEHL